MRVPAPRAPGECFRRLAVLAALAALAAAATPAAAQPERLPEPGSRLQGSGVRAAETALIRVSELTRRERADLGWQGILTPLAILQGEQGALIDPSPKRPVEEPLTGTPLERYTIPAPGPQAFVPSPAPALTFMGLDDIPRVGTSSITIPPDVDGAVGPNHILEGLNNNYRTFDRNGTVLGTISITTFWSAAGGSGFFDPKTLYDPIQQRWIAVALCNSRSAQSSIVLGVSLTDDPTGSWFLYRVLGDSAGVHWADFPCIGFNKNWIAINVNMFSIASNTSAGGRCLIVDYAQARAGTFAATMVSGTGFCSAPAVTASATENTLYVPTHLSSASGTYRLDTITGTPAAPVYTVGATRARGLTWTQPSGSIQPQAAPLAGTSVCGATPCPIETQDAQIRTSPVFRDGSIWYTQTVGVPAGGLTHTAVQWTRLDAATGNVAEGGRIEDPTATATNGGKWYNYPHLAVNGAGDVIVSFTQTSSAQYPSAGYAFRSAADPAGTMRDPVIYKPGEDYYHKDFGSGRNRWGDYSKAQVDPADDTSLWVVSEYSKLRTGTDDGTTGSNSSKWGTWWARVGPAVTAGPSVNAGEGASGGAVVNVAVNLNQAMPGDVTVSYSVSDGTATLADGDYDAPGTSVVIPAGLLTANIPITVNGDAMFEGDETLTVTLTSATGAPLGSTVSATVTILNDDPLPAIATTDATAPEGDAGTSPLAFTLTLSNPSSQTITVDFATSDGTASVADGDYAASSGTATILPGALSAPVVVTLSGDVVHEPDETFTLALTNPVNASLGVASASGTLQNDDARPALAIEAGASVAEGNSGATLVSLSVTLSGPSSTAISVDFATQDGTASESEGDYDRTTGTLTFPALSLAPQAVQVPVNGDLLFEGDETFTVELSNPSGASVAAGTGTATIVDDEGPPALSVADATVAEGASGGTLLEFVVTLSHASHDAVSGTVAAVDGTATLAGGDYAAPSASFSIPALATSTTVQVVVNGDGACELDETLALVLSEITGAAAADTQAAGTIGNDDECTAPAVAVLSPDGGETLQVGDVAELSWTASDSAGVTGVDLELSRDGGGTFETLATGEANDGSFSWTVAGPVTVIARLRVTGRDAAGNSGTDLSDAVWTIAEPSAGVGDAPVTAFALTSVHPNPALTAAAIAYALPRAARVRLTISDLQGRTVAVLVDGVMPAGRHEARWAVARGQAPAGIYFARFEAGGKLAARRFAVTR